MNQQRPVRSYRPARRPFSFRSLCLAAAVLGASAGPTLAQCFTVAPQYQCIPSDGTAFGYFGTSCTAYLDTVIVGAPEEDAWGAAYVYRRGANGWNESWKIMAGDLGINDLFGFSVAMAGNTVVIGSPNDNNVAGVDAGAAYIFVKDPLASEWVQQAKLASSDLEAGDHFGYSVAIVGDTVIVGSRKDTNDAGVDAGAAYVFQRSGSIWTQQAKLTASDGVRGDAFGESVAIADSATRRIAIVGAEFDDNENGTNAGAAYAFTLNTVTPGSTWGQAAKLLQPGGSLGNRFGAAVAASGSTSVVTALFGQGSGPSSASVYTYAQLGGFSHQAAVTAGTSGDYFGISASISGSSLLIGAADDDSSFGTDAGCAYLFTRTNGVWTQRAQIFAPDAAAGDAFGSSVAISGNVLAIGARLDDVGAASNMGSAHTFELSNLSITQQPVDAAPCGVEQSQFTVAAQGSESPTYQWQYRRNGDANWVTLVNGQNTLSPSGYYMCFAIGATAPTLTLHRNPDGWRESGEVRCIVSNACGNVTSDIAAISTCYSNCDCSTQSSLTANDFQCFLNTFATNSPLANCDSSQGTPRLTANDFQCFLNRFSTGCQ